MSFNLAGDVPDLQSLHLHKLDVSIGTITPCKVGFIQHEAVRDLCNRFPRIASAFWRETLIDGAIFREWVANIGQRNADARIAHLLCELFTRMQAVGLNRGLECDLPITQTDLSEATGMSSVHVNRSLQSLRGLGLFTLRGRNLKILDWEGLTGAATFEADYLHLSKAA